MADLQQQKSALADSVAHSGRKCSQAAIYRVFSLNGAKRKCRCKSQQEGRQCCRQLPSWMVLIGKARIWTTQREGTLAAPVTDRPTLLSLTDLLRHTALSPFETRLKYT